MTAEEFKTWRSRLDMTQQDAADTLGVTKRSVQGWEDGTQPIKRSIALACAAVQAGLKPIGEA